MKSFLPEKKSNKQKISKHDINITKTFQQYKKVLNASLNKINFALTMPIAVFLKEIWQGQKKIKFKMQEKF